MKLIFKWINTFLTIGIFFIALGIIYVAVPYFGNQALIVRSGSMSPAIDAGSIVVIRPEVELITPQLNKIPKYNNNDIIAFRSENNLDTIITHRVVESEIKETGVFYKTKGDANKSVDGWVVNEENILGKTYFTLPFAGHILAFAKSSLGFPLLIVLPAILVVLFEVYNIIKEIRKNLKSSAKLNPGGLNITSLKVLIPLLIVGLSVPIAFAFPSDTEKSANNIFTAAKVFSTDGPSVTPTSPPTDNTPTPSPTPSETASHVVISEVQISGDEVNLNDDEFVELYNPTSSSIVMSGWRLTRKNSAGTQANLVASLNGTIPAHGYFLIVDNEGYNGSVTADANYSAPSNALTNNYTVLLYSDAGVNLVDKIGFGIAFDPETSAFSSNPSANGSVERKAFSTSDVTSMTSGIDVSKGNGFDSDDNSVDFILRTLSEPQNSGSATESP